MKANGLLIRGLRSSIRSTSIPQCRQFRTTTPFAATETSPIQAAPAFDQFGADSDGRTASQATQFSGRPVPASPSYFTGRPNFTDDLISLQTLHRRYELLPRLPPGEARRIAWKKLTQYREAVGDNVGASKYKKLVDILHSLNRIHPELMPEPVKDAIERYRRDIDPFLNRAKPIVVDRFGRAVGTGKRKTSTARAWVVEGDGEILVNGKTLVDAFGRVHDRESAIWALKSTDRMDKYNVWALVEGGGTTGQAEALTMAVAKGLLAHEPLLKPALRRAGCITRDPRNVERKKAGHLKARKRPTWVKR